jgi:hypothetical protein
VDEPTIIVEWGVDDEPMYESHDQYGIECPESLWLKYQAALEAVGELEHEIGECSRKHRPPPKPGTLGYAMWKMYRDMILESNEKMARMFGARTGE